MRRLALLVAAGLLAAADAQAGPQPVAQPFEDCLPEADHVPGESHAEPAREVELSCWTTDVAAERAGPLERLARLAPRVEALRADDELGPAVRAAEAEARAAVRAAAEAVDELDRRYQRLSGESSSAP